MNVLVFTGIADCLSDNRRTIQEAVLEGGFKLPFTVKHFKILTLSQEAIDRGLAVGNHYHDNKSGRHEFFVILGGRSEKKHSPVCKFRYREPGGAVQETELMMGDACFVPVGWSHAFLPLKSGLQILGISNTAYSSKDDVPDQLFGT